MPDELVEIASYWTARDAAIARAALEGQGLRCFMEDDQVADTLVANAVGWVKIFVAAADAVRAREILSATYDDWPSEAETWICPGCGQPVDARLGACGKCRHARPDDGADISQTADAPVDESDQAQRQARNPYAPPRAGGHESADAEAEDQLLDDDRYSRCPDCGEPRTAICPFCQTSGGRFKVAFTMEAEDAGDGPAMLICPTCDEPFEPEYLRQCDGCGHDFGAGRNAPPVASQQESEPRKLRVLAAALAAIGLIVGLLMYFAMLLK